MFESIVIIWQVKSLKLGKNNTLNEGELEKNLRQLAGARRQLVDLKTPITLQNPRRTSEQFDPSIIKEIFLVSVLLGDSPDMQSLATQVKSHHCHVFDREFTEVVLNELDTIDDFCGYLREKERVREHIGSLILEGGEKELLGYYLFNERSFAKLEGHSMIFLEEGTWNELQKRPEYKAKKKADEVSYVWDKLIERAHTSNSSMYERIARELARPNRFDRRCLANAYFEAHCKANDADSTNGIFRRVLATDKMTICFLFTGDGVSRKDRRVLLEHLCFVTRGKMQNNNIVVGIATEMKIRRESSLDYCLFDIPEWGPEQQEEMERLQEESGTLTHATVHNRNFIEYPETR